MSDETGDHDLKVEGKKRAGLWDRWPGKIGVPLLTCVLGVGLKDGCDRYNHQTATLDYFVVPTSSLIQRPDLGGKPLSVIVDGRPVDNLSTVTLYLANRSGDDYENVPVEVSFAMPDNAPVELLRESVVPNRFAPMTGATTLPASRVTRRYLLGVANRQRVNEALLKVEYVFAGAKAPDVSVYVDKKGLVAGQVPLLRKEDVEKWVPYVFIATGFAMGLAFVPLGRFGDRWLTRLVGNSKGWGKKKEEPQQGV